MGMLFKLGGVSLDRPDNESRTPLSRAARSREGRYFPERVEGLVKMLFGREEVNSDRADTEGRTPLSHAAEAGFEGALKV